MLREKVLAARLQYPFHLIPLKRFASGHGNLGPGSFPVKFLNHKVWSPYFLAYHASVRYSRHCRTTLFLGLISDVAYTGRFRWWDRFAIRKFHNAGMRQRSLCKNRSTGACHMEHVNRLDYSSDVRGRMDAFVPSTPL